MKKTTLSFPRGPQFEVPIYGGTVVLLRSEAAYNKALEYCGRQANKDIAGGRCAYLESKDGLALYLVGWYTTNFSTLVHECCHLAIFILERAGIDPLDSSGETLCYLQEYLVEKFGINKKQRAKSAREPATRKKQRAEFAD